MIRLVASGFTNQQIGSVLFLSTHTVKSHLHRLSVRWHCRSRSHVVSAAFHLGILTPRGTLAERAQAAGTSGATLREQDSNTMAMSPLDTEFLSGLLQANDMTIEATRKYLDMAKREGSDPLVIDVAVETIEESMECSGKIRDLMALGGGDSPSNAMTYAMDNVQVVSNDNLV